VADRWPARGGNNNGIGSYPRGAPSQAFNGIANRLQDG